MRRLVVVCLVAGWVASVAGAYWWGGRVAGASNLPTATKSVETAALPDAATDALKAEIARLNSLLDEHDRSMMRMVLDTLSARPDTAAPQASRTAHADLPSFEDWSIEAMMDLAVDIDGGERSGIGTGFYDDLGGFLELMLLAVEIGRRGDTAVPDLRAIVMTPMPNWDTNEEEASRQQSMRDFALQMLADLRSDDAAPALIEIGQSDEDRQRALQGLDRHLREGNVDELKPHAAEILSLVDREYAAEGADMSAAGVAAAQLAFRFEYAPAYRYAADETLIQAGWSGMLNAAKDAHTDASWRYLNWVAGNSENADARQQAQEIIDAW